MKDWWMNSLRETDPEAADIMQKELERQDYGLELIPSENYISKAVMEAMGSVMNNKYSEGYPGKRYYGGNQFIDMMENLAIERAKKLFRVEHVNVQPYSGSPANLAVYFGLLEFGDKFMGMNLAQGGHLTHGHPVNFTGKSYSVVQYGVDEETERIDMDEVRKLAEKEKPRIIISGATAYPREFEFREFAEIAKDVGAYSMADIAHIAGLIIGKVHATPFPFTDVVTTTTHKTLRGPRGAVIMCKEEHAREIDRAVFPGMQGGPHEHIIAGKAVCFKEAMKPEFKTYQKQIMKNARALAESLMDNGFRLVSGGTDNHLMLIDLQNKGLTGKEAETLLDEVGITLNKNMIPYDPRKPFDPSGVRLGTPALTTRGMKESEMKLVGELIHRAIDARDDRAKKRKIREEVREICKGFPLYPGLRY
jgi:glycine hydroxymethyltransferase